MKRAYHIVTYGCAMNYSDSERVASVLEGLGYVLTNELTEADLLLYNTCSVRQKAEDRFFGLRRKWQSMKKKNPWLKIALTGCIPAHGQYDLERKLPEVDIIFNIENLERLPVLISETIAERKNLRTNEPFDFAQDLRQPATSNTQQAISNMQQVTSNKGGKKSESYFSIIPKVKNKFQVTVPVMTGCNNFCSYCIVPYARGREKSRSVQDVLSEVRKLVGSGAKEVTLLGQNVNSYRGLDKNGEETNFPELLRSVDAIPGYQRLEFSSSHPKDCSDQLIECFSSLKKLNPHMHLALQAGNDEILQAMNRKYKAADYMELVKKLRLARPDISITTDIIVGFPGETESQFEDTRNFVRQIGFDMIYISPYSIRPGTAAAELADDVPDLEKKRRFRVLTNDLRDYLAEENKKYLGKTLEILVENFNRKGEASGKAPNYKTVVFPSENAQVGELVEVEITEALAWELRGTQM